MANLDKLQPVTAVQTAETGRKGSRMLLWATLLPLVLLVAGSIFIEASGLDLRISRCFYDASQGRFPGQSQEPWKTLDDYGCFPGFLVGTGGLLVALLSIAIRSWRPAAKGGLVLAAIMVVGPGLLVNVVLKPHWGRPRPDDTVALGGTQAYFPFWSPGTDLEGGSFPSGHASIGFYLIAPGFLLWQRRRRLAVGFFALGMSYGSLMGFCRVVQGRHFVSDILWSAAIVYFTCVAFYVLFFRRRTQSACQETVEPADAGPDVVSFAFPAPADAAQRPASKAA